jgi:hypothetical protein
MKTTMTKEQMERRRKRIGRELAAIKRIPEATMLPEVVPIVRAHREKLDEEFSGLGKRLEQSKRKGAA